MNMGYKKKRIIGRKSYHSGGQVFLDSWLLDAVLVSLSDLIVIRVIL